MRASRLKGAGLAGLAVVLAAAALATVLRGNAGGPQYAFAMVERGILEEVITSTGTLTATETVEVGTQVSGQIAELFADFNDAVKEGQLLARLDPSLLEYEVQGAEANLMRAQADLEHTGRVLERNRALHEQNVVTDGDLEELQYRHDLARSACASARVSLDRARRNLTYTEIRAPIAGRVIQRSVDVGQTVAAAMTAPTFFVIARDLAQMQILATVYEGDIGRIREGQDVRFTVQAYSALTYEGTVRQVRLGANRTDNVVSYDVLIDVANPGGELLPGMTATVRFVLSRTEDVLKVPNTALRFQPAQAGARPAGVPGGDGVMKMRRPSPDSADGTGGAESIAQMRQPPAGARVVSRGDPPDAVHAVARTAGAEAVMRAASPGNGVAVWRTATLWRVGANGALEPLRVLTGASDGRHTAVAGPGIEEGMAVAVGSTSATTPTRPAANPFHAAPPGGAVVRRTF